MPKGRAEDPAESRRKGSRREVIEKAANESAGKFFRAHSLPFSEIPIAGWGRVLGLVGRGYFIMAGLYLW